MQILSGMYQKSNFVLGSYICFAVLLVTEILYQSLHFGVNTPTVVSERLLDAVQFIICRKAPNVVSAAGSCVVVYEAAVFI